MKTSEMLINPNKNPIFKELVSCNNLEYLKAKAIESLLEFSAMKDKESLKLALLCLLTASLNKSGQGIKYKQMQSFLKNYSHTSQLTERIGWIAQIYENYWIPRIIDIITVGQHVLATSALITYMKGLK